MTPEAIRRASIIAALGIALAVALVTPCAEASRSSSREEALLALCRVWNAVRFTSPELRDETDVRWDDALLAVVPELERDPSSLERVTRDMLAMLHDPLTRIDTPETDGPIGMPQSEEDDGIKILRFTGYPPPNADDAYTSGLRRATELAPRDHGILIDLRTSAPPSGRQFNAVTKAWSDVAFAARMSPDPIIVPAVARRYMIGFPTETGQGATDYTEGFETVVAEKRIQPPTNARVTPVAFLVDRNSILPDDAVALARFSKAMIFSADGSLGLALGGDQTIDVGAQLKVDLRTSGPMGGVAVHPGGFDAALSWLKHPVRVSVSGFANERPIRERYAGNDLPDEAHRILAAFRIWGTIAYAYPYRALMHDDWDDALREALLALPRVQTALQYQLTLMRFYSHIHDSHGFVVAPAVTSEYAGTPPFAVRDIEGHPTIVRVDPVASRREGLAVGDVVLTVDGESVSARAARLAPFLAASTIQSLRAALDDSPGYPTLFAGRRGVTMRLTVRKANGTLRLVRVMLGNYEGKLRRRTRNVVEILPGNVGYMDLTRLNAGDTEAALRRLARTRALVLDLRGYVRPPIPWIITSHLLATRTKVASFATPVVRYAIGVDGAVDGDARYKSESRDFDQFIDQQPPRYDKPVVAIIDARAVSLSEHAGLFLRAASNARFVGESTAGTDGDFTQMIVPGNVALALTGQAVTWPDGRQLQRVGLIPDVPVSQTLSDLRLGIDDQLSASLVEALRLTQAPAQVRSRALAEERALEIDDAHLQRIVAPVVLAPTTAPMLDIGGFGAVPPASGYRGERDSTVAHHDGHTVVLRAERGATLGGGAFYRTDIDPAHYRGKRLRISGYLRSEDVQSAGFEVRIDTPEGPVFDVMSDRRLVGTNDWTPFAIIIDVPSDATGIAAGPQLLGATGAVWSDDLRIDIVDESVKTTS